MVTTLFCATHPERCIEGCEASLGLACGLLGKRDGEFRRPMQNK
jgi:hypothetical protein